MIPEYKLYHGAVLAELVDQLDRPASIDELAEEGRLSSYIVNGRVGLHIKHSANRMHPWQFTFTAANLRELTALQTRFPSVFLVFVCHTDGMVCLSVDELKEILTIGSSAQASLRISRRPGKWYSVTASRNSLSSKKPKGLDALIECLAQLEKAAA
jgi:hypothetical protein